MLSFKLTRSFTPPCFDSRCAISKLRDETRRFHWEGIRAIGRTASQLSWINDIPARYESDKAGSKTTPPADKEDAEYAEIATPNRTKRRATNFSKLSDFCFLIVKWRLLPNESVEDAKKVPPFIPSALPKFCEKPRIAHLQPRGRADKYRM